jgi:hypothetical protein
MHDVSGTELAQRMGGIGTRRAYQLVEEAHFELAKWFALHRSRPPAGELRSAVIAAIESHDD